MYQVKFVEDSLKKTWSDMVCLSLSQLIFQLAVTPSATCQNIKNICFLTIIEGYICSRIEKLGESAPAIEILSYNVMSF